MKCRYCGFDPNEFDDYLEGHRSIYSFLHISRSYYYGHVKNKLEPVLFRKPYKNNRRIVFTFKPLVYAQLLKLKEL